MSTKEYDNKAIAERIEILRNQNNMSVNKLATVAGVDTGNLSRSIKGKASFSDRVIYKIANAFHVSIDWLERGIGPMFCPPANTNEMETSVIGSNVNGSNSSNVSQIIGGDAALQAENRLLREQNEFLQNQVKTLLAIVGQK